MNIEGYNFHWREGYRYGFPLKRFIYHSLFVSLKKKRITVMVGTRRTGKTTLMKQLIGGLIDGGTPRQNILFYSFDEERPTLRDLMAEFESKIGKEIAFSDENYYFFLDEIQKLDDWQNKVKYLYDQYQNLKIIISGSASLYIRKGVRESLAGRVREFTTGPLSFREYLRFKGNEHLADDPQVFSETLQTEFEGYMARQYIEVVGETEEEIKDYANSILEKVVYVDIPQMASIESPHLMMKLVAMIASNPGMIIDYNTLAQSLSSDTPVSRVRVSNYMHQLEDAYLIRIGYNYSRNGVVSERKLKKAYLANPTLSYASPLTPCTGKMAEQTFFLMWSSRFFWRNPQKEEVDIILEKDGKPLPIEVKYKRNIADSDLRGIRSFMRRHNIPEGVVITRDKEEDRDSKQGRLRLVPAWKAALEGVG